MDALDRIKELCKKRNIPISRLERDCGFSNGYIGKLKEGSLPSSRLQIIADYLNVSAIYLLEGTIAPSKEYYDQETYEIAQKIFDNSTLKALFDVASDFDPELLEATYNLLASMKRKERNDD